ncbi:hypothetical protein NKH33_27775 [Mesorhizobium sp. M1182]|uniref:hypothetical protein n=1 Tax=Mesorhizobium sp. M1182 TaxID=2957067 RepID=UPI00333DE1C8
MDLTLFAVALQIAHRTGRRNVGERFYQFLGIALTVRPKVVINLYPGQVSICELMSLRRRLVANMFHKLLFREGMMAELKHGGSTLGRIHAKSNGRKVEAYWLGFLEGVLASESIESLELASIRAEAEQFRQLFGDADAADPSPLGKR